MKRLISALIAASFIVTLVAVLPVRSGITCSLPFNLTNGTTADASQVMANYNALAACMLNNLAASGANNDITSLTGLTTPLAPSGGGTTTYVGGTSVGTNTLTLANPTPNGFSLVTGNKVIFTAGASNTGATTLNVNGTGVKNIFRADASVGLAPFAGAEIIANRIVEVVYDGTQYQIQNPTVARYVGEVFDFAGTACPSGSLEAGGSTANLTATFPSLSSVLTTTWGNPGGGAFALPDLRGRSTFSRDAGGSGRITVAGGNFDGTAVGGTGGQQSNPVAKANLAAFALNVTDPGHTHGALAQAGGTNATNTAAGNYPGGGGSGLAYSSSNSTAMAGGLHGGIGGFITTETTGITVASGGSSTPLPTLSNAAIVLKCVKA